MTTILTILLAWFVISIPVSLLIARLLAFGDSEEYKRTSQIDTAQSASAKTNLKSVQSS